MKELVETAQYSVHCIGLVYDGASRTLFLADGNGPLLKGGSMEFVSLPFRKLPRGVRETTSVARWDRDQAAAAKANRKPKARKAQASSKACSAPKPKRKKGT